MNYKQRVANNFSKHASSYHDFNYLQRLSATKLKSKLNLLTPKSTLDLGCGVDPLIIGDSCIGLDIAHKSLLTAKTKKASAYVCADYESLPFKNNSFDLIYSNLALQWSDNLTIAIDEIKRVLAPNGYISLAVVCAGSMPELISADLWVNPLPSFIQIQDEFASLPKIELRLITETVEFNNAFDLLASIKNIGASGILNKDCKMMSKSKYRQALSSLEAQNFKLSYNIGYIEGYI